MPAHLYHYRLRPHDIQRDGPIPIYQQIRHLILEALQEGVFQPNDRLPSEQELADILHVSRMTVRRTLQDLLHEGYLYTLPGRGTYVRQTKLEQYVQDLHSFTDDMEKLGHRVTSRVLQARLIDPTPALRAILHRHEFLSPEDAKIVLLERVRLVDGEPIALEVVYLPHRLCPGLLDYDFSTQSLYRILGNVYHLDLAYAEQTCEAIAAGSREAELLGIPIGAPLFYTERTVYLGDGRPIEYGTSYRRGDRYTFRLWLGRPPAR
jgi:GntR family transcriptional regulator